MSMVSIVIGVRTNGTKRADRLQENDVVMFDNKLWKLNEAWFDEKDSGMVSLDFQLCDALLTRRMIVTVNRSDAFKVVAVVNEK